jgi:hypothetical protein
MRIVHPQWSAARIAMPALLACAAMLALASAALADTYTPTRFDDPAPNGCRSHDCSLREAITRANHHAGTDKIVLKGGKTYKLTRPNAGGTEDLNATGDLDVLDPLTITSSSSSRAIVDANNNFRAFETFAPTTFKSLTIKRGNASAEDPGGLLMGGGLFTSNGGNAKIILCKLTGNFNGAVDAGGAPVAISRSVLSGNSTGASAGGARVSISRSTISGNQGWGVADLGGSLSLWRSTVSGNSPGLYVTSSAVVSKSTIKGNSVPYGPGGGIYVQPGDLRLTNSTVSGNRVTGSNPDGGGIAVGQGSATLVNDTIDGNHADGSGGGIYAFYDSSVRMNAVTVAHNQANADGVSGGDGGGIVTNNDNPLPNSTFSSVKNSLIALNSATGSAYPDCKASVSSGGQNLLTSDNAGCPGFSSGAGDFLSITPTQLKLDVLSSNGGPTKTDALLRHSKAIDHAGSDAPTRDQRGFKRDAHPDIGAYEKR